MIVVVFAFVATAGPACTSSSHPTSAASAKGPSGRTPPSSPGATSRPTAIPPSSGKCHTADLTFTIQQSVKENDPLNAFLVKNRTSLTCTVQGYFGLTLRDAQGRLVGPVPSHDDHLGGFTAPAAPIELVPQAVAQFQYQWDDAPSAGPCVRPASIDITAPDQVDHVLIPARSQEGVPIAPCGAATVIGPTVIVP